MPKAPQVGKVRICYLARQKVEWQDLARGWHTWQVEITCPTCGKPYRDTISGTLEDVSTHTPEPGPCCDPDAAGETSPWTDPLD
jgi:hypothetical protein